jgi:Domain of unknown function (DUF4260)
MATEGTVVAAPHRWLRIEAATLLAGSLIAYSSTHRSWWLVPVILFLPDLFMVGYLGGAHLGAIAYNLAHNTALPTVVVGLGWWQHQSLALAFGLVWLAHIGMDRLMGFGLKYNDNFQHTHLGHLGRTHKPR